MYKRIIITVSLILTGMLYMQGQNHIEALRYSQQFYSVTAKSDAMGNALSAVGADMSALTINPAGIAVFKKSQFTFTPNFILSNTEGTFSDNIRNESKLGFNISNIGGSLQYDEGGQENFLPTNLKFGGGFDFIFDQDNVLAISTEFNKLLVPTPRDFNGDGDITVEDNDEYQNISFFNGIFESFGDAPDGFSEELKEVTWALGAEYRFREAFMLRSGYFNESEEKGSRKFFTLGAGFKYKSAQIDLSYLFSTSQVRNPLENTLRFSLTFSFGEEFYND